MSLQAAADARVSRAIVPFAAGALFCCLSYWQLRLAPECAPADCLSPWQYLQAAQFGLGALFAGYCLGQSGKSRQQLSVATREIEKLLTELQVRAVDPALAPSADARRQPATAQHKSQFLSTLNHELRAPMNGMLGMTHLLQGTPLSPEQARLAHGIGESGNALMGSIKDLLDFAEIETGSLRIDSQPFALRGMVEPCVAGIAPRAQARNLLLHCTLGPDFPEIWIGDGARTQLILHKLLDNAVKFTDSGSVSLSVQQTGASASARLRLEVSDTGIGIEPRDVERLFQPFSQIDGSDTRRHGGMGLGLVICQQLVQLMHGSIGFSPVHPRGSRFWVELPMPIGSARDGASSQA